MLPGFRFLFAAIVLSISILVFGLGAAALLRAAHEEFASNPGWRAVPEPMVAQQGEATRRVLAMLRLEPRPAQPKASDNSPAAGAEPAAIAPPPAEPEQIAAPKPAEPAPAETAKPDTSIAESPAPSEATAPEPVGVPTAADDTKIATSAIATSVTAPDANILSTEPVAAGQA